MNEYDVLKIAIQRIRTIQIKCFCCTMFVDNVVFGGVAEKQKIDFDWEIKSVQVTNEGRPAKQWFYLVALGLISLVWFAQKGRIRREDELLVKT